MGGLRPLPCARGRLVAGAVEADLCDALRHAGLLREAAARIAGPDPLGPLGAPCSVARVNGPKIRDSISDVPELATHLVPVDGRAAQLMARLAWYRGALYEAEIKKVGN